MMDYDAFRPLPSHVIPAEAGIQRGVNHDCHDGVMMGMMGCCCCGVTALMVWQGIPLDAQGGTLILPLDAQGGTQGGLGGGLACELGFEGSGKDLRIGCSPRMILR